MSYAQPIVADHRRARCLSTPEVLVVIRAVFLFSAIALAVAPVARAQAQQPAHHQAAAAVAHHVDGRGHALQRA